jgi:hypothetical protein
MRILAMLKPPLCAALLLIGMAVSSAATSAAAENSAGDTYTKNEIVNKAAGVFGNATEGFARAIERVFLELGEPNAYITGREGSGAFVLGVRYGDGELYMKASGDRPVKVYWQGPSVGFDFGGNASKTFTLIYNLPNPDEIFQRFPGLEGSVYYVAGFGVNYQQIPRGRIVLAPVRTGVGLRAGVNAGYLSYTKARSWVPL